MNILFRTSGGRATGKQLGLGHVYRCINLAEYLKPHKLFFLIEDFGGVRQVLREKGFNNISVLRKGTNLKSDIERTIRIIKHENIGMVVVDKYDIQTPYLHHIRKYAKIVVISDLEKVNMKADLLVNGFIGFNNKITTNRYNTRCLLGPRYQILNKNFANGNVKRKKRYHLLATFGGYDENKITETLLEQLVKINSKFKTKIILGPSTIQSTKIRMLAKKLSHVEIVKQTKNMYNEMLSAEFGLCSGGITSYEFATLGVPFAIISQVKHQMKTAKEWEKRRIALNLGLVNDKTAQKIRRFLQLVAQKKISHTRNFTLDGRGAKRVAKEILQLN